MERQQTPDMDMESYIKIYYGIGQKAAKFAFSEQYLGELANVIEEETGVEIFERPLGEDDGVAILDLYWQAHDKPQEGTVVTDRLWMLMEGASKQEVADKYLVNVRNVYRAEERAPKLIGKFARKIVAPELDAPAFSEDRIKELNDYINRAADKKMVVNATEEEARQLLDIYKFFHPYPEKTELQVERLTRYLQGESLRSIAKNTDGFHRNIMKMRDFAAQLIAQKLLEYEPSFSHERIVEFGQHFQGKKGFTGQLDEGEVMGLMDMFAQMNMSKKQKRSPKIIMSKLDHLQSYLYGKTWSEIAGEEGIDEEQLKEEYKEIVTQLKERVEILFNPSKRLNLENLTDLQQRVMKLRYDRFGNVKMTQYEVAEWLNVSQANVAQIENRVVRDNLDLAATLYKAEPSQDEDYIEKPRDNSLYLDDMIAAHARNVELAFPNELPDIHAEVDAHIDVFGQQNLLSVDEVNLIKDHLGVNPATDQLDRRDAACSKLQLLLAEKYNRPTKGRDSKKPYYKHELAVIDALLGNKSEGRVPLPREILVELFTSKAKGLYHNWNITEEELGQKSEKYRRFLDRVLLKAFEWINTSDEYE